MMGIVFAVLNNNINVHVEAIDSRVHGFGDLYDRDICMLKEDSRASPKWEEDESL